jgi:hypothetical protein
VLRASSSSNATIDAAGEQIYYAGVEGIACFTGDRFSKPATEIAIMLNGDIQAATPLTGHLSENPPSLGVSAPVLQQIEAMTRSLFPGPVTYEYSFDPEDPTDEYVIFGVVAKGEFKDYRDTVFQWHDEVRKIVPGSGGEFSLSVTPIR